MTQVTTLATQLEAEIEAQNAEFERIISKSNWTPISDLKTIFGAHYYGPEAVCELFGKTHDIVSGVRMNPFALEKFAKAGFAIMYMPAISVTDIVAKTVGIKQKDDVVMYCPYHFNTAGSITKPWFKAVDGFDFSPYILGMQSTKPRFVLCKREIIQNTQDKTVSGGLPIQKEYLRDILGDTMPVDMRLACDSLNTDTLKCLARLEDKDWQGATGMTLSLPFVQTFWAGLVTDMFQYAVLSSLGEKTITRRGMYHRVKTASPYGDVLMFGGSGIGANVNGSRADNARSDVGLSISCILDVV